MAQGSGSLGFFMKSVQMSPQTADINFREVVLVVDLMVPLSHLVEITHCPVQSQGETITQS